MESIDGKGPRRRTGADFCHVPSTGLKIYVPGRKQLECASLAAVSHVINIVPNCFVIDPSVEILMPVIAATVKRPAQNDVDSASKSAESIFFQQK